MRVFSILKKILIFIIFPIKRLFSKKVFKLLFCFLCLFFLIFSPTVLFNERNFQINMNKYLNLINKEKVILELWHIETFEGGTNSRSKFLEKMAINFNKMHSNFFLNIKTLTEEQLFLNLAEKNFADIYSFGIGAGYMLKDKLETLMVNSNLRSDLQEYGKSNAEILCYPYILSGYTLITKEQYVSNIANSNNVNLNTTANILNINSSINNNRKNDNTNDDINYQTNGLLNVEINKNNDLSALLKTRTLNGKQIKGVGFAKSGNENISKVLIANNLNFSEADYYSCTTTYDAYTNFLNNKFITLVGTNRDVARLKNREAKGLISCVYNFLPNFSDLVQYIGISKTLNSMQKTYATNFLQYLTTFEAQQNLNKFGLFSTTARNIYESGYMLDFETTLQFPLTSINVFTTPN